MAMFRRLPAPLSWPVVATYAAINLVLVPLGGLLEGERLSDAEKVPMVFFASFLFSEFVLLATALGFAGINWRNARFTFIIGGGWLLAFAVGTVAVSFPSGHLPLGELVVIIVSMWLAVLSGAAPFLLLRRFFHFRLDEPQDYLDYDDYHRPPSEIKSLLTLTVATLIVGLVGGAICRGMTYADVLVILLGSALLAPFASLLASIPASFLILWRPGGQKGLIWLAIVPFSLAGIASLPLLLLMLAAPSFASGGAPPRPGLLALLAVFFLFLAPVAGYIVGLGLPLVVAHANGIRLIRRVSARAK